MSHRQQDGDARAGADREMDGGRELLDPLLQKNTKPLSGDTHVHSAFLVDAHDDGLFSVSNRLLGCQYQVKRAASCLMLPEPGDKVLVSGDAAGGVYIIAVLEQGCAGRTTLQVDGELAVSAHTLSLKGRRHLALETDTFSVQSRSGAIDATDWAVKSRRYTLTATHLDVMSVASRYSGNQRESYYQSVSETMGRSARYITGTDTVKAVNLDYSADFIARLSGDTTLINGETLVKADGKQILVG